MRRAAPTLARFRARPAMHAMTDQAAARLLFMYKQARRDQHPGLTSTTPDRPRTALAEIPSPSPSLTRISHRRVAPAGQVGAASDRRFDPGRDLGADQPGPAGGGARGEGRDGGPGPHRQHGGGDAHTGAVGQPAAVRWRAGSDAAAGRGAQGAGGGGGAVPRPPPGGEVSGAGDPNGAGRGEAGADLSQAPAAAGADGRPCRGGAAGGVGGGDALGAVVGGDRRRIRRCWSAWRIR